MQTGTLNEQNRLHHWLAKVIVLTAIVMMTGSCATADAEGGREPAVTYQVTFVATEAGGIGPTRAVIRLDTEFAVLDGNTGCHRILGSFTLDEDTGVASFTVPGISTNNCDAAAERLEQQLLSALDEVASFGRADLRLEFFDADQTLLLVLEPIS